MKRKIWIAMNLLKNPATEPQVDFIMPDGCAGMMLAFYTKKDARKHYGKDVNLLGATSEES